MTVGRPGSFRGALGRLDPAVASEQERSSDRHRRIAIAGVVGVLSKALVAGALLLAVPLVADHLDGAELGVWSVLVSAVALVGWSDFGLGNGLLALLSDAQGRDDPTLARRMVTSAAVSLCAVATLMAVASAVAVTALPWESLFGLRADQVPALRTAVACFAGVVVLAVPASIGQRIHLAYQQGWAASATTAAGSVLALVAVWLSARAEASLPVFVLAMVGGTTAAYLAETIWVFTRSHRDLLPQRSDLEWAMVRRLARSGAGFFALVLAGSLAYQTDALVIANHLGAADATPYVLTNRLFMLVPTAIGAVLLPLWPAYGEALARGDDRWVRDTLRRSLLTAGLVASVSAAVLLFLAGPLLRWWEPTAEPTPGLLYATAAWSVVFAVSQAVAMYLNGARLIRLQVVLALAMAAANLAASILLVRRIGIAGPVWASVATQSAIVLMPLAVILGRRLRGGATATQPDHHATPGAAA